MAKNHLVFAGALLAFVGMLAGVAPASHQPAGGGEDCASATSITALPFSDTGTTGGAANDYDPDCVYSNAPDVVYSYTPPVDLSVDISLCGSYYDTALYVYAGACGGSTYRCNDDSSCGLDSMLEDVPLTAGTTYYIVVDGYGSNSGNYVIDVTSPGALPGPGCPADALFGQAAHGPDAGLYVVLSDSKVDYRAYENFWGVSGLIGGVRWWGFQLSWDGANLSNCTPNPDDVTVTFYHDASGQPGSEACGPYEASPTVVDTGLDFILDDDALRLYEFSIDVNPTCTLGSGWVSIQSTSGDPDCWAYWLGSPDGDSASYERDGDDMDQRYGDLSLCLMGQSIPDEDGDGVPDDLDVCPGFSDQADADRDGVPNGCDLCPQTPTGVQVDADGCTVFDDGGDDDGDGVSNKCDICPNTPTCAVANAVGCPIDSDGDGAYDGCDLCPGTSRYAVVDADGCAITDARQAAALDRLDSCCGMAGPVAPLGLAVGMLLLSRVQSRRGRGTRQ